MSEINTVTISGRMVADPELKYTKGQTPVCSFAIASDIGYGEKKRTVFPEIVAWQHTAQYIARKARKGMPVVVHGTYDERIWEDKDGRRRKSVELICREMKLAAQVPLEDRLPDDGADDADGAFEENYGYQPVNDDGELPF